MAAKGDFLHGKLDETESLLRLENYYRDLAYGNSVTLQYYREQNADLFDAWEQTYHDKTYTLYTDSLSLDYALLSQLVSEYDTVAGYGDFLDSVQTKAGQLAGISIFQNDETGYDLKNIEVTAAVCAGLGETAIDYYPQKGLYTAISYAFTDLILLVSMLVQALLLVRQERDSGLLSLVRSLPGGRLQTALAKLGAFALSLLAVLALLYGVNLAYCAATFGLGPLTRTIHAGCLRAQLLSASKRGFLLGLRHKTHATSVYKEEARKLLLLNGAALVLAAFAGFGIYQGVTAESYIGPDEIYYAYYMKHTSGPFTQESYDWLEEQGEEFAPMLEVQRKVAAGELSSDAMLAFSSLQQKYSVYSRVINQNINYYLKEHPGAWLVYESGYKELFGFTGDADVQDTLLAGLACALCFSGLFSMERRGGMETILCTTPLGRKRTVRAKLAVSAGVAVLIAAASCLPHLIQVLRDYGLPALFAPAMSISEFESLPALFTLSDVLLFWFVCRIAACLCMGAITLTLGRVFGNLLPALFVSAVGYCLPALLSLSGMDGGIEWLGFWPLFHAANFFTPQGYAGEEGLPYNNAWVILLLLVVVLLGTATLWGYLRDCYEWKGSILDAAS